MEEDTYLFKVVVRGFKADNAVETIFDGFAGFLDRKSPMVFYAEMTGTDAIQMMNLFPETFEITRAKPDWHI